jgi:hypothetical protein
MNKNYLEIYNDWKLCDFNSDEFSYFLKKSKWVEINKKFKKGIFKRVFTKNSIVVKFDDEICGSHTLGEYRSWAGSSEERRKFICPPLFYKKGLLIQPLLKDVYNGSMERVPRNIQLIAKKYRFSHWWNYGFLNGKLKFYDTDGLYYQLTDKEERVK